MNTSQTLREVSDLPGPRGLPLLGNLLQVERNSIHQSLKRKKGPYSRLQRSTL